MSAAKPFLLCYEATRKDGVVWAVKHGRKWHLASDVTVMVTADTVYRGPTAKQPRAYLEGIARLTRYGRRILLY